MASKLQEEIQQTKPFASLETEALLALMRTTDQLALRGARFIKQWDLSPTQYNVLRILRGAEPDGLKCREIGDRLIAHDPDVTRLLDRLEKRGLVARQRDSADRRVITTRITASGLAILAEVDQPIEDFNRRLMGPLDQERLQTLIGLLDGLRQ